MSTSLLRLVAALLLAALSSAQDVPHFEIDLIFPRNESYFRSDVFPIAFVLQNVTAARSIGEFDIRYFIMPYGEGHRPSGIFVDRGLLSALPGDDADEHQVYIANSNVTDWITGGRQSSDGYMLQVYISWSTDDEQCEYYQSGNNTIMFSLEGPNPDRRVSMGVEPEVVGVPECPVFSLMVELRPNATHPSCPGLVDRDTGREATPCAVKVDDALASRIDAEVASLAVPTETPTDDKPLWEPEDEDDAAPGVYPPINVVLGTALALMCLAFAT